MKIVRRLSTAQEDMQPVTIRRKGLDADEISGFVVAVIDEWVVLQDLVEAAYLDRVILLRIDYVTKVMRDDNSAYVSRAVAGLGVPLEEFVCPSNASVGELLRLVDDRAELVCVYLETREDYWLALGKILRIGPKRLDLHYVGRDVVWADFVERWKLKNITRIEFGGRYMQALERFSDPMPTVAERVKR